MVEQIPDWLFAIVFPIVAVGALYVCWIKPGYEKDRAARQEEEQQ